MLLDALQAQHGPGHTQLMSFGSLHCVYQYEYRVESIFLARLATLRTPVMVKYDVITLQYLEG